MVGGFDQGSDIREDGSKVAFLGITVLGGIIAGVGGQSGGQNNGEYLI